LNEGFTVTLERRIIARIRSEEEAEFQALLGYYHLRDDVDNYFNVSKHPEFTQMVPKLNNIDPDDSFSSVPYETGFNFLYYLAGVVGGKSAFEKFLYAYFEHFAHKTLTSEDMKQFFLKFFADKVSKEKLDTIQWNKWFTNQGMPLVENQFDKTLSTAVEKLVKVWTEAGSGISAASCVGKADASEADIKGWSSNQICYFLDKFTAEARTLSQQAVSHSLIQNMDKAYSLTTRKNAEIKMRWQMLCLKANYEPIYPHVITFITEQGRMKFVRPLYRTLAAATNGKQLAVDTFTKHANFYHSIARKMIARDLGVQV